MASASARPDEDSTANCDVTTLSSDDLATRITHLSSEISAATCHMLLAIAEFDSRQAWADWGSLSCANWLSWRCGLSPGAAREHVRVARRLAELPQVVAPFSKGKISFSKVRAIIRVATQDNIEALLELAQFTTAAQLEMITGAFTKVAHTIAEQITGRTHARRYARWRYAEDGSVLICARLDAEEGAVVINALEAAVQAEEDDSAETPEVGTVHDSAETPEVGTVHDSAETPRVEEEQGGEPLPELLEVTAPRERPQWEKMHADALVDLAQSFLENGMPTEARSQRYQVFVHVDADSLTTRAPGLCEIEGGHIVMPETARRLTCDSAVTPLFEKGGKPLAYGRRKRFVSPQLRRAVEARDKGCRFPGCNRKRVDIHHIKHWIELGETEPANLVSLCWAHHRLVHEEGFKVSITGDAVRFFRPDGVHLPSIGTEPIPDVNDIAALRKGLGISGDPEGLGGKWDGEALTFDALCDCVDALLLADGLTTREVERLQAAYAEPRAA
jgi:hypothetical protein